MCTTSTSLLPPYSFPRDSQCTFAIKGTGEMFENAHWTYSCLFVNLHKFFQHRNRHYLLIEQSLVFFLLSFWVLLGTYIHTSIWSLLRWSNLCCLCHGFSSLSYKMWRDHTTKDIQIPNISLGRRGWSEQWWHLLSTWTLLVLKQFSMYIIIKNTHYNVLYSSLNPPPLFLPHIAIFWITPISKWLLTQISLRSDSITGIFLQWSLCLVL